ncbi:AAA family ATPase [Sulfitobacter sp. G21635-S1]|uniref:AAA family ATPase n=1 Tax=Rhodobacterales TaxID=204455 RepID=UPI0022AF83DC|nr:AAA family ATPase [Sulfitobacter sp. G21635-S1]MCZ4258710.1 AAA family ATPase [Sulfitobacter sp. G21635-S1]
MPFLTDMIQSTQRGELTKRALVDENCAPTTAEISPQATNLLNSRFTFDLTAIELELRRHIVGQDQAIALLLQYLRVIRADIGDPRKPLASILFSGPTGVGKTEMVRVLARAMYGDADAVCRIDMNTLAQDHYSAAFTGAPPGYVGSKEGTTILDQSKIEGTRNLPGIVLLDELEKASDEVVLALLNVFDNGLLTVASGERTVSFRNAIIFMTSNLGSKELIKLQKRLRLLPETRLGAQGSKRSEIVLDSLLARFPPEFVNRIDHIETFNGIDSKVVPAIIKVEVDKLNRRLRRHGCQITLSLEVVEFLSRLGFDNRFGARGLRRLLRKHLEFPLAEFLLAETKAAGAAIEDLHIVARKQGKDVSFERM